VYTKDVEQTQGRERAVAAAMHVGSIFAPVVVPAVVWAWQGRESAFVAAHAKKALKEALVWKLLFLIGAVVSLAYTISRLIGYYQANWEGFSFTEFLVRMVVVWLLVSVLGIVNTLLSVRQAMAAFQGRQA
jgi:uncharacterized Tic20 family protein